MDKSENITAPQLVLASASPRRHTLLKTAGIPHIVRPTHVAEVHYDDRPETTALENTRRKLTEAIERNPGYAVIAADTVLEFEGRCLGKPPDLNAACNMLQALSGNTHKVITATGLFRPNEPPLINATVTVVKFRPLTDETIGDYFRVVNPLDKAGGYDIGDHGELLLDSYDGSWTNIIGLPMEIINAWWHTC